jgi:predicted nucleotidyltransferase
MIDLSASTDPDIAVAGRVLAVLEVAAERLGVDYLVVGATARNILSMAWFDRLPPRATRDVDVAVAVPDWSAFRRLTAGLSAEVEELADAVPGEVGDRPAEEGPVGPRPGHGPTTPAGAGPGHGSRASRAISSVTWR